MVRTLRNGSAITVAMALTAFMSACARSEDPDCASAERALEDAGLRARLKAAVQRQFDAGELGAPYWTGVPDDMPGKYAVPLAREFKALTARPLQQRVLFDARGNIEAIFVGWPPGHGVLVEIQTTTAVAKSRDFGDGVALVCEADHD